MLSKGRCGRMLGRCWRLLLLNCVVKGEEVFQQSSALCLGSPFSIHCVGSQEGSVAVLSFCL